MKFRRICFLWLAMTPAWGCPATPKDDVTVSKTDEIVVASIRVEGGAFVPAVVHLQQGNPGALAFSREIESGCLEAVRMPWLDKPVSLPIHKTTTIAVDTNKAGTFRYSCWMNMVFGRVTIDPAQTLPTTSIQHK